jgi:signal transduction histidine kinase
LVVDDSEDDTVLVERELTKAGYEVVIARVETADALRSMLRLERWDVILCDYNLPSFGPVAAIAILREMGRDIAFVVVSGTVEEEAGVEVLKAGAHDFVLKHRIARLVPAVEREMREAEMRHQRRQAIEELKLAVQARDEFLSIASHELRTPLTALNLQVHSARSLLDRDSSNDTIEELRAKLKRVARQADRLASLIENLLDVSKITSARMSASPRPADLSVITRQAIDHIREIAECAEAQILLDAPGSVIGFWDPELLDTIVRNLLSNAVKFGGGKPIDVRVSEGVSEEGKMAYLAITDRGIGIEPEAQQRIFERFERAVSVNHYGGFGIGLWVTRQATEAQGGRIRVSSAPGVGSTFVVELPRAAPLDEPAAPETSRILEA